MLSADNCTDISRLVVQLLPGDSRHWRQMASLNGQGGSGQPGGAKVAPWKPGRGSKDSPRSPGGPDPDFLSGSGLSEARTGSLESSGRESGWSADPSAGGGGGGRTRARSGPSSPVTRARSCPKGGGSPRVGHLGHRAGGTRLPQVPLQSWAQTPGPESHFPPRAHDAHTGLQTGAPGSPPGDMAHYDLSLGPSHHPSHTLEPSLQPHPNTLGSF